MPLIFFGYKTIGSPYIVISHFDSLDLNSMCNLKPKEKNGYEKSNIWKLKKHKIATIIFHLAFTWRGKKLQIVNIIFKSNVMSRYDPWRYCLLMVRPVFVKITAISEKL